MKPEVRERLMSAWHRDPVEMEEADRQALSTFIFSPAWAKVAQLLLAQARSRKDAILGLSPLSNEKDMEALLRAQGFAAATISLLEMVCDMTDRPEEITFNTTEDDQNER